MKIQSTYLRNLKFDNKLKDSLIAKYLSNPRLILLLIITIVSLGLFSFLTLPRVLNPEIKIPIVLVSTVLPGANPKDVESLVTIPLEDAIAGVSDIKQVNSVSRDSVSAIQVEFNSGVDPDKARSDIQSATDSVVLPDDAQTPRIQKLDFENQPIWTFTLTSRSDDLASLIRFSKNLQKQIKDLDSVDEVSTSGIEEQEIQIYVTPATISTYGLNIMQISQAVTSALKAVPAGSIQTDRFTFSLAIDPTVTSINDLRETRVNLNGVVVKLGDIATVSERSKPNQNVSYYATPESGISSGITLNVFRNKNHNIGATVEDVQKVIDENLNQYDGQFQIQTILNAAEEVDHQFSELTRDFVITIALVFLVLLIFLGIRQAAVSALTIPFTFFISFSVMKFTGITLNFLSLFSLLLSLGLLVDDAIVVISAMSAYARTRKFTPLETGLLVWRDFWVAIFTTTITTVWAFLPLLLASGIIGEFIKSIPIVVSTTLLASFVVAMFITLPIMIFLLKPYLPGRVRILLKILLFILLTVVVIMLIPKDFLFIPTIIIFLVWIFLTYKLRNQIITSVRKSMFRNTTTPQTNTVRTRLVHGFISFEKISATYKRFIDSVILSRQKRRLTIVMVVIFSIFSYLLLPLGFVQNEFFPKSDQDTIYVNVELPPGTNLSTTKQEAQRLLADFKELPGIKFVSVQTSSSYSGDTGTGSNESNNLLFNVVLLDEGERNTSSIELAEIIRDKYADYSAGTISVVESTGGPPAGSDLQIKLFGNDLATLDSYGSKIQDYLRNQAGVVNINKTVKSGTSKMVFVPDLQKMADLGVSVDQVGLSLRTFASGFTVDSVRFSPEATDDQDITVRLSTTAQTPEDLGQIMITTTTGNSYPLSALGSFRLETNPTLISRENNKRTISVTAGVTQGYNVATLNQDLEKFADTLDLPSGYSWATGGVNEENQNSVQSILAAMLLSFLLIILTMVLQFGSFRKALIVMLVIPLSISGVFIIFALTQTPLSFPALIGVLALFGIVVKNSILVVDKIDQNVKSGMKFGEAVSDGAASRLEAIALTSFCAIIGLIPITLSDPIWRGLGGAIIAGLAFSGTIMLFFIPVVYAYWFEPKAKRGK